MKTGIVNYTITIDNEVLIYKGPFKEPLSLFHIEDKSTGFAKLKYSCNGLSVECYGDNPKNNYPEDAKLIKNFLTHEQS